MCDSIVLSRDGENVSLSVDPDGASVTYDCGETSTFRRGIQCVTDEFLSTGWVTILGLARAQNVTGFCRRLQDGKQRA